MKGLTEFLVLIVYLAIVFTMVRPGSQGPSLVTATGNALGGLLTSATGGSPGGGVTSGGGWAAK